MFGISGACLRGATLRKYILEMPRICEMENGYNIVSRTTESF